MGSKKRLAKNTGLLYFRMLLVMAVSLYTSRVVLKTLGFDDYGVYDVIAGVVAIFGFLNGAMSGASARFLSFEIGSGNESKLKETFSVLFYSHLGIALCVLILSETIGVWLILDKLTLPPNQMVTAFWVFQISILSSMLAITLVPYSSLLISYENMKVFAYAGLVEAFSKLGVVFLLVKIPGNKLLIYALLLLGIQILMNLFYRFYCIHNYSCCNLRFCKNQVLYKEIFGFVGGDLIGNISVLAQGQGLNILLNIFFGPAVNAARGITYQVQGAISQFSNNFTTAMRPQVIKLYAEQKIAEMFNLVIEGSCFSYYMMWLIILPVLINVDSILHIWLGKYPPYTVPFLNIVLFISLVQTLKTPRTMIFHALGKVKTVNLYVGLLLISTFPISYLTLKLGGSPISVFIISLCVIIISEFVSVAILKRYIDFNSLMYFKNVHLKAIWISILSGFIPLIYKMSYQNDSTINLIISILLSLVSVSVCVLYVGMDTRMRQKIFSMINSKLSRNKV